jgi:quinoprotein glucose dehydrogenase
MQHRLRSAIDRQTLIALSLAVLLMLPRGIRAADEGAASPDSSVFVTEWPAYARDPGGMRHSPLRQINRRNVRGLKVGWAFRTGELATYEGAQFSAFEATPIMVDRTLYFSTPSCRVFALDAATGRQRWLYDPKIDLNVDYVYRNSRGVSTWVDLTKRPGESGYRTIFLAPSTAV